MAWRDSRQLPFAAEFFDAIVSLDSFFYYGTDDLYLQYLARLVKRGGAIGIAGVGLMHEIEDELPAHLKALETDAGKRWGMGGRFAGGAKMRRLRSRLRR